ncbi:MAG: Tad domain-containing protein [Candidatus Angelobacter sp.]
MKISQYVSRPARKTGPESGQTTIFVLLVLGIFFLAFLGFAVDYSNLWFHRQMAQTAADAACQAGAADLLVNATNGTSLGGFPSPVADFDCTTNPGAAPCKYALLNGYSSAALAPNTPGTNVTVSFPATVPGAVAPSATLASTPYIKVAVRDRTSVYFSGLLTASSTTDVGATATCGLTTTKSPIPIIVLDPHRANALSTQGNPDIIIVGGTIKSIQVNSDDPGAVNIGGSAKIDLSHGGPNGTGSDLGVLGGPTKAPGGFIPGATGDWRQPSEPISDPFARLAAPTTTGLPSGTITHNVKHGTAGCPDPKGCDSYTPGLYPTGIHVKNGTAIFDPGIYYVTGGMSLEANSTVRPSSSTSGIGGTMFYFSGSGTISVDSNSGKDTSLDPFVTSRVQCPGGPAPTGLPATLSGNVLMGPCSGTYGDPDGQYRGMLFFQDRAATSVNPSWGGGGQFLLVGNMYFHSCKADGSGTDCTNWSDTFTLQGNSGSGTFVIGEIVADSLQLGGTSGVNMNLNPNAAFDILKVELLQ